MLVANEKRLVDAMERLAGALRDLGLADAGTPMGAIEVLAMEVKAGSERMAEGLQAIAEGLQAIAGAIEER